MAALKPWEMFEDTSAPAEAAPAGPKPWEMFETTAPRTDIAGPVKAIAGNIAAQKIRPATEGEMNDATITGLVDSATVGTIDEITGAFGGFMDWAGAGPEGSKGTFAGGYERTLGKARERMRQAQENAPGALLIGEIGGGLLTAPFMPGAAVFKGATSLGRMGATVGNAAVTGAGYGTLYGFASGEGGIGERAKTAAGGFGTGLVLGGALGTLAAPFTRKAPPLGPAGREAQRLGAEFKTPLTVGNITQDVTQIAREQSLLHGGKGEGPQKIMGGHAERQGRAFEAAAEDVQQRVAGGHPVISREAEAGEQAVGRIKSIAQMYHDEGSRQLEAALGGDVVVFPELVDDAKAVLTQRILDSDFGFDRELHPSAFKAIDDINNLLGMDVLGPPAKLGATVLRGSTPEAGLTLKAIDTIRRRLLRKKGVNDEDRAAVKVVRRAFDDWFNAVVDARMFDGDPHFVDMLKQGRSDWRRYREMSDPDPRDPRIDAKHVIERMVERDVTGQEAANWMLGSASTGRSPTTVRVAREMKSALGHDSEEWSAIRQAAFMRLIRNPDGGVIGPQRISSNIKSFLDGRGRALAGEMFSEEERALIKRYGQLADMLVPKKEATNLSHSSYGVSRDFGPTVRMLITLLGFHVAGPVGGALGAMVGSGASRAARAAVNPRFGSSIFSNPKSLQKLLGAGSRFGAEQATQFMQYRGRLYKKQGDTYRLVKGAEGAGLGVLKGVPEYSKAVGGAGG